jgi:Flp pilus assembly secretin CpaC
MINLMQPRRNGKIVYYYLDSEGSRTPEIIEVISVARSNQVTTNPIK